MPATTTEGTGPGSVEEIRRKIHNSLVREENILPELLARSAVFVPVGAVIAYGSSTAPKGWLSCLGQEVYRGDYPDLFAVIGTTYGAGNGTTTFNLPNLGPHYSQRIKHSQFRGLVSYGAQLVRSPRSIKH
jgi:hypothetical protein